MLRERSISAWNIDQFSKIETSRAHGVLLRETTENARNLNIWSGTGFRLLFIHFSSPFFFQCTFAVFASIRKYQRQLNWKKRRDIPGQTGRDFSRQEWPTKQSRHNFYQVTLVTPSIINVAQIWEKDNLCCFEQKANHKEINYFFSLQKNVFSKRFFYFSKSSFFPIRWVRKCVPFSCFLLSHPVTDLLKIAYHDSSHD